MESIYFTTITVDRWVSVFNTFPETNIVILESFTYLSNEKSTDIYAFVIMKDHIHIVWDVKSYDIFDIVTRFKRYTGNAIIKMLKAKNEDFLYSFFVSGRQDRKFKFWKLNSSSLLLKHSDIVKQKIIYTHNNPLKGNYKEVSDPTQYVYSSARSYIAKEPLFSFLKIWEY